MSFDDTTRDPFYPTAADQPGAQADIPSPGHAAADSAAAQPAGFCQDCGRPLTRETARFVGRGIFCELCLQRRLSIPPGGTNAAPGTMAAMPGEPKPALAGLLGLIPGVGAMYNGQFAKGFAHIVIFAVLVSLTDNVNGIFGLFVASWVIYQAFDAYHTAQARRQGLPLPDLFGLNDIGERIAARRAWSPAPTVPGTPAAATEPPAPWTPPSPAAAWTPVPPPPAAAPTAYASVPDRANWAGYVPPSSFSSAPYVDPSPSSAGPAPAWEGPYAPTSGVQAADQAPAATAAACGMPLAPIGLIGLGVLFLIANILPGGHVPGHWIVPVLLIVLAGSLFYRRLTMLEQLRGTVGGNRFYMVSVLRPPLVVATLALIFTLQALEVAPIRSTWPLLLIVLGALLLIERAGMVLPAGPAADTVTSVVPPSTPPPDVPSTEGDQP